MPANAEVWARSLGRAQYEDYRQLRRDIGEAALRLSIPLTGSAHDVLVQVLGRVGQLPAHVRFSHPDAGYEGDRARAAERLAPGRVYVLREYHVGHSHSTVELDGFPDFRFNAVQFAPATHGEYEDQG